MILFRTKSGQVLGRMPEDQFFLNETDIKKWGLHFGTKLFVNSKGHPVDADGKTIEGEIITKFVHTYGEYVKIYPEAENYRSWFSWKYFGELLVVQSYPRWGCMPGCVLNITYYPEFKHPVNPKYDGSPRIVINDGDDCDMEKRFPTNKDAKIAFEELKLLAPFSMPELKEFGYYVP